MSSLREKLESAFAALLEDHVDVQVAAVVEEGEVNYPYILCAYTDGETYVPQIGITRATVVVQVVSEVDARPDSSGAKEHNSLVSSVVNALETDCLHSDLTQAGKGLMVLGVEQTVEGSPDVEERGDINIFTSNYSVRLLAGHK